ncbi:hypothetical protein GUJ93_ZPchr0006g45947 [Zizania palustris]|uniref:Cupin type-1 domain-containing protein n=1 Tax=Zizania palustris TaxID=103762 RepID=A0A8J5VJS4_ZIZPA|nr:hypothetical protein GUJ93_ZPchr0006g45947 [Zizania palustris]
MAATVRWLVLLLAISAAAWAPAAARDKRRQSGGHVVEKERRRVVAASDAGLVTAVDVADAAGSAYRLHFITMNPGALWLPVQLHADMVFYVHGGRGKVTYIKEGSSESESLQVERGDVYNFEQGTILYIQSYRCATRNRLQIYAIFTSDSINADDPRHPTSEAYSDVSALLKGFDVEVLRRGFGVPREVVEAIKSTKSPPAIIPYNPEEEDDDDELESNWKEEIADALWGVRDPHFMNKKKDKHRHKGKDKKDKKSTSKAFNFFSGKPDVENCYGWSKSMTNQDLEALQGSDIGMFMVNLTTGAMMGPHWNPKATEFAIVTKGVGMVQTVCPSIPSGESKKRHHEEGGRGDHDGHHHGGVGCKNSVLKVKEGDVFVVPRFHPMAQISFNNDSFVFVGFSTDMGHNHPQFLAGKQSVLQAIGKEILSLSLGQANSSAVERLLSAQRESTIMACTSCAEQLERAAKKEEEEGGGEGERVWQEEERRRREEEREREEEERRRHEEEWKKREEEERERREREEEERRQREKEEKRREQEEKERREQEAEKRRRREEEEEHEGGRGKEPEEEEEEKRREQEEREREAEKRKHEEEEEHEGGRGKEREEEEEGDWTEPQSRSLKKRFRVGKLGLFRTA